MPRALVHYAEYEKDGSETAEEHEFGRVGSVPANAVSLQEYGKFMQTKARELYDRRRDEGDPSDATYRTHRVVGCVTGDDVYTTAKDPFTVWKGTRTVAFWQNLLMEVNGKKTGAKPTVKICEVEGKRRRRPSRESTYVTEVDGKLTYHIFVPPEKLCQRQIDAFWSFVPGGGLQINDGADGE